MSCGLHIYWVNLCPGVACMPTPSVIVYMDNLPKYLRINLRK